MTEVTSGGTPHSIPSVEQDLIYWTWQFNAIRELVLTGGGNNRTWIKLRLGGRREFSYHKSQCFYHSRLELEARFVPA
jgi:hypothetical protein